MILMMAFSIESAVLCWVMKIILRRDNRKLVKSYEGTGEQPRLFIL
jgi:hypothetical protein